MALCLDRSERLLECLRNARSFDADVSTLAACLLADELDRVNVPGIDCREPERIRKISLGLVNVTQDDFGGALRT